MVWIDSDTVYVEFPKHVDVEINNFNLKLINNITHKITRFEGLIDKSTSELLYRFEIDVTDLEEGEYSYQIYSWITDQEHEEPYEYVFEGGLLINGHYDREDLKEFNSENENKIVQFNG